MKIVILCGGRGIQLKHQIQYIPKGLVYIDEKPIIWHIMKRYSQYGFNEFILALGKNGNIFRNYFLNYNQYTNDIGFNLGKNNNSTIYNKNQEENWNIIMTNTGEQANTGARLYRCKKYINSDEFMVTYSDCLSNIDINKLIRYHKSNKNIATITGVKPPFRYGEFTIKKNKVVSFSTTSKLSALKGYVNGGFMVFNKKIFNYLNSYNECTLEKEVFTNLVKDRKLDIYKHDAFWQCLDTDRELTYLKQLSQENKRYWLMKS